MSQRRSPDSDFSSFFLLGSGDAPPQPLDEADEREIALHGLSPHFSPLRSPPRFPPGLEPESPASASQFAGFFPGQSLPDVQQQWSAQDRAAGFDPRDELEEAPADPFSMAHDQDEPVVDDADAPRPMEPLSLGVSSSAAPPPEPVRTPARPVRTLARPAQLLPPLRPEPKEDDEKLAQRVLDRGHMTTAERERLKKERRRLQLIYRSHIPDVLDRVYRALELPLNDGGAGSGAGSAAVPIARPPHSRVASGSTPPGKPKTRGRTKNETARGSDGTWWRWDDGDWYPWTPALRDGEDAESNDSSVLRALRERVDDWRRANPRDSERTDGPKKIKDRLPADRGGLSFDVEFDQRLQDWVPKKKLYRDLFEMDSDEPRSRRSSRLSADESQARQSEAKNEMRRGIYHGERMKSLLTNQMMVWNAATSVWEPVSAQVRREMGLPAELPQPPASRPAPPPHSERRAY